MRSNLKVSSLDALATQLDEQQIRTILKTIGKDNEKETTIRENNTLKNLLYVALFVALFIDIHSVFEFGTVAICASLKGLNLFDVATSTQSGHYSDVLIAANLLSSVAAFLFILKRNGHNFSHLPSDETVRAYCFGQAMLSVGIILQHNSFTKSCKSRCPTIYSSSLRHRETTSWLSYCRHICSYCRRADFPRAMTMCASCSIPFWTQRQVGSHSFNGFDICADTWQYSSRCTLSLWFGS